MSLETEVAALTQATTDLLDAVNIRKTQLDGYIAGAQSAGTAAAGSASAAEESADEASTASAAAIAAKNAAEAASTAAAASQAAAAGSASAAEESADEAGTASTAAVAAKNAAEAASTAAAASQAAAASSASAAAGSANTANQAAQTATAANDGATISAAAASGSAAAAATARAAAEVAQAAAVAAQNNAVAVVTGGTASVSPQAGRIPIAGGDGKIDPSWLRSLNNDIGAPGAAGFGAGICPALPAGYTPMPGFSDPASENYGNYTFTDGSVMVWVPAFYYRIGHPANPTFSAHGLDSVDVKPVLAFESQAAANAQSYALHRAFIDGGAVQPGFFFDKYMVSNNGGVASSLKNGNAISFHADHNPASGLNGAPSNIYASAITAAKTRGAQFHAGSIYQYGALALLSLAHGQAATSATWCAWYDAAGNTNFPKGCNNNALRDTNDSSVLYVSDGYSNCGKTGSGAPFAKTTHNGQASGVADLNGLMWEVAIGVTCIAAGRTVTGAAQANPVAITSTAHGYTTGDEIQLTSIGGMTQINDRIFTVTVVDANTFTLNGVDGTAFAAYTSGGTATKGAFHCARESTAMRNFTSGTTLATDHWGATGVAAMMEPLGFSPLRTTYAVSAFDGRVGNGAEQVLDPAVTGPGYKRTGLGLPRVAAQSASGTNRFGQDRAFQHIRNELALLVSANWGDGSTAGVWARNWNNARGHSTWTVGCRAASYL